VRLEFKRDDIAAFYPHQAVLNCISRALRLAELPVRFTEGFNPHPRVSMPYAMSVGVGGEGEVVEIELHSWVKPSAVMEAMNRFLPRGLAITRAKLVPPRRATCVVVSMSFEADIPAEHAEHAHEAVNTLMAADSFTIVRGNEETGKSKPVDIRRYIECISLNDGLLSFRLEVTTTGTARPREILAAVLPDSVDVRLVPVRKRGMEIRDAD
jgi:radical SAM-linked protein